MLHVRGTADTFERRRSDQDDLQQLRPVAFAVRQKPKLLQNRRIKMLRFIDDENRRRIQRDERRKKTMERGDEIMNVSTSVLVNRDSSGARV